MFLLLYLNVWTYGIVKQSTKSWCETNYQGVKSILLNCILYCLSSYFIMYLPQLILQGLYYEYYKVIYQTLLAGSSSSKVLRNLLERSVRGYIEETALVEYEIAHKGFHCRRPWLRMGLG